MGLLSLREIQTEVDNLVRIIYAQTEELPTYGFSRDFGHPHIEVDGRGYHYVVVERGEELQRRTTSNLDELLFWIFESITFDMAFRYAAENRIEGRDRRRIGFAKEEELLGLLNPQWAEKEKEIHTDILKMHPFDDLAELRAAYCGELRKKGFSEAEITKQACEKYPTNTN